MAHDQELASSEHEDVQLTVFGLPYLAEALNIKPTGAVRTLFYLLYFYYLVVLTTGGLLLLLVYKLGLPTGDALMVLAPPLLLAVAVTDRWSKRLEHHLQPQARRWLSECLHDLLEQVKHLELRNPRIMLYLTPSLIGWNDHRIVMLLKAEDANDNPAVYLVVDHRSQLKQVFRSFFLYADKVNTSSKAPDALHLLRSNTPGTELTLVKHHLKVVIRDLPTIIAGLGPKPNFLVRSVRWVHAATFLLTLIAAFIAYTTRPIAYQDNLYNAAITALIGYPLLSLLAWLFVRQAHNSYRIQALERLDQILEPMVRQLQAQGLQRSVLELIPYWPEAHYRPHVKLRLTVPDQPGRAYQAQGELERLPELLEQYFKQAEVIHEQQELPKGTPDAPA